MEKKQLFDSSFVGFHPNTLVPHFELNIDIGDYNIYEDFTIEKDIALDDNFIDIYNKIEKGDFCSIRTNITNNNNNSTAIFSGYKGTIGLYFRDAVILQASNRAIITNLNFTNIDISSKTASIIFIRKILSQSDSDNTVVRLTTTVNGLTNLKPGDFNETVTLTTEEYNALNEIPVGEIFLLNNGNVTFLVFKNGPKIFRASRDYIDGNLANRSLVSVLMDLGENNQATFKGNVTKLMDFNNYLAKDNTTKYTPTNDYNPATKKYVDDRTSKPFLNIASLLSAVRAAGIETQVDVTNKINSLFGSIADFKTNYANQVYLNNSAPVTLNTNLDAKNEFMFAAVYGGSGLEDNSEQNVENNAFKLYYYNFKINDDNTVVTGYYNTIDIIRDPDRPNQYLSVDGTYKYPYAAGIYFSKDNSQVSNNRYWGNYVIEKEDNNGNCVLALISDCTQVFDETSTNDITTSNVFGIGGFGILNRIANNSYPYSTPIFIEAIIGVDTKNIKNNRLYTNTWMILPCVVKYQSKYYIAIRFGNTNDKLFTVMGSYLNIIGMSSNLLDSYIYLNCEEDQLYPTGVEVILEGTYFNKENLYCDKNNLLAKTDEDGYMSKEDKTKLDNTPIQKVLTESEYAALGTTPETDNVLYFITPD